MKLNTAKAWGVLTEDGKPMDVAHWDKFNAGLNFYDNRARVRIVRESDWPRILKGLRLLEEKEKGTSK